MFGTREARSWVMAAPRTGRPEGSLGRFPGRSQVAQIFGLDFDDGSAARAVGPEHAEVPNAPNRTPALAPADKMTPVLDALTHVVLLTSRAKALLPYR
jgi:hypothetical protein